MRLSRDGIAGLIGLAISVGLLPAAMQLPKLPIVPVGPGFYATIVLVFLAAMSALLVVQDLAARRAEQQGASETAARETSAPPSYGLVLAAFVIVGGYVALLPYLGFRLSTLLFVALFQGVLDRPRNLRQGLLLAVIAIGTALVTHMLFEQYLSVLLPRGRWTDF